MSMKSSNDFTNVSVVGVDIGKDVFHLVGFDSNGKLILRKKIKCLALDATFEKLPRCIVGMEACLSAHFVSRTLRKMGFEPRIIPAIYVKPFIKGQKNDYNDAEAIAEAALRPNLPTVSEKSQDQLDLQALHRVRSRLVSRRTATINQIRAFLIEQGITVRRGLRALNNSFDAILENRKEEISLRMRSILLGLRSDWLHLDERIETVSSEIEQISHTKVSRRGSRYLRMLLVQAAKVILMRPHNWPKFSFGEWLTNVAERMHRNKLAVALANKLARVAWSVLRHGKAFDDDRDEVMAGI